MKADQQFGVTLLIEVYQHPAVADIRAEAKLVEAVTLLINLLMLGISWQMAQY